MFKNYKIKKLLEKIWETDMKLLRYRRCLKNMPKCDLSCRYAYMLREVIVLLEKKRLSLVKERMLYTS